MSDRERTNPEGPRVAIVDFGMGNLFSVSRSCEEAGMRPVITSSKDEILAADAVILPGVGAFGDAMQTLHRLDLVSVLREIASSEVPLIGICLGMQLLMSESEEFGATRGLDVVPGRVVWLRDEGTEGRRLKVPEVGWNAIRACSSRGWEGTPLKALPDGTFMYFVHSLVVMPDDPSVTLSTTTYGPIEFCSTLQAGNVFACQYHPERSGRAGREWYRRLERMVAERSRTHPLRAG